MNAALLIFAGWYLFGLASMLFWIERTGDITVGDVLVALVGALMGPVAFFSGWLVLGDELTWTKRVVLKSRHRR